MRRLKKILLALLVVVGVLFGGIVAAAVVLIAEPQWVLTTRTVAWAARVLAAGYQPRWKTFSFDIRSLSFPEKEVRLRAGDLCFENPASGMEGCFKDLDVQVGFRLYCFGAKMTKISKFLVSGDHFNLDQTKNRQDAPPSGLPTSLPNLLPAALRGLKFETLRVDLPANEIISASGTLRADLRLSFDAAQSGPMVLKLELEQRTGKARKRYHGEAFLDSDLLKGNKLSYLDARGRLNADGVNARFQARVEQKSGDALAFKLNASARLPGRRVEAGFEGAQNGQRLDLSGTAGVWEASGPIKSVQLKPFTFEARLKKDSTEWERLAFDGRFELEPETSGVKSQFRGLARTLEGRLLMNIHSTPRILEKDHIDAEVSAVIKPINDWYEFHGGFEAKASGRASQVQKLNISQKLDMGLKVAKFEKLVEFLSRSPYSVPAPICVLQGPLSASIKGGGDLQGEQVFDYEFLSGLAAGRQALKIEVKGKLIASKVWALDRSFKDETNVILQDIALQLPRFDTKGIAPFTGDSRINNGPNSVNKSSATALAFELRLKTAKPVLFYSNLAKDPVPIVLDIKMKSPTGGFDGAVELRPFRAEIFRRTASIDHIKLSGRAGSTIMDLDGLIVYQAAEAKIFIRLLGSAQKPRVMFESDPPMTPADIMAMLLFGKSPNELDSDQQSSVAKTQTAVANGAFGLASLYLLASTPVDYVGYDPVARTYTIKFRLPGGATLQVGSDGRNQGVQLRKRLASHLAVQTELTNSQTQGSVVTTFLEWFGRH